MKDMKRTRRRHHVLRLKKARRHYHACDQWQHHKLLGIAVHTPQLCSCRCCGNQRDWEGRTIQERKQLDMMKDQVSEVPLQTPWKTDRPG